MTRGRKTKGININGRRCSQCKKNAKDLIDGEYLCRVHSPMRQAFEEKLKEKKK